MNRIDLDGRVAIVTGGAQGIGYATAQRMLRSGAKVIVWDIDETLLARSNETLRPLGPVAAQIVELSDERPMRRSRNGARSTSSSTTPASPAATARPGSSRPRYGGA
jgi:3-oxoacyl-[acyl-carrier protein] reductase